jgi:hypothetical protein
MSILDDGPLGTAAPKTYGDQLPGRKIVYKDGVEEKWTVREAKAIRGLALGYSKNDVCKKCRLLPRTLREWMGNPYFMMEVTRLTDHNVFRFRARVLETVALRAIAGSPQHARLYLQVTKDLRDESGPQKHIHIPGKSEFDHVTPEEIDEQLTREINKLTGK